MPMPASQPLRARPALPGSPPGPCPDGGDPGCACPPGQERPLPNPAAVRLYRVPDSAPPYDEPAPARFLAAACSQPPGPTGSQPPARTGAQPLAATGSQPPGPAWSADSGGQDAGHGADSSARQDAGHGADSNGATESGQSGADGGTGSPPGREARPARPGDGRPGSTQRTGAGDGSSHPWPGRFAQVLAETLAGSRPPRQMDRWATERARTHIRRLGAQLSAGQQPRIRRVITSRPARDVVEMTVVVGFGPRVRALAVRLERAEAAAAPGRPGRPAQWVCTAVEAA